MQVVYIAPMKALVAEMVGNFQKRLDGPYGIKTKELTGTQSFPGVVIGSGFFLFFFWCSPAVHVLCRAPMCADVAHNATCVRAARQDMHVREAHLDGFFTAASNFAAA